MGRARLETPNTKVVHCAKEPLSLPSPRKAGRGWPQAGRGVPWKRRPAKLRLGLRSIPLKRDDAHGEIQFNGQHQHEMKHEWQGFKRQGMRVVQDWRKNVPIMSRELLTITQEI